MRTAELSRITIGILALCTFLIFFGCASGGGKVEQTPEQAEGTTTPDTDEKSQSDAKSPSEKDSESGKNAVDESEQIQQIESLFEDGLESLFQGLVSEGIKQLVSCLAVYNALEGSYPEADKSADKAEAELTKLEAEIAIEADTGWLDESMNQKTGSTMDLALQPSIILMHRGETGRSLISNAPVVFEFVQGGGIISGLVNTNDYGQANCSIARLDSDQEENVIRAALVYRIKGYTYRFTGVVRDFVYSPPSRKAMILVLERSTDGISEDPLIFDPVFSQLQDLTFDLSHFDARLAPADFMKVYGGDSSAISKMALDEGVSYLIVVLNDCNDVRQLEIGGKKRNLFVSDARATTRIVRVADGKIMYQTSVESTKAKGTHGQGGTMHLAIADVLGRTSAGMVEALRRDFPKISKIMTGNTE